MAETKGLISPFALFTFMFLFALGLAFCSMSLIGINKFYKTDMYNTCVYAVESGLSNDANFSASSGFDTKVCPGLLTDMKFANIFFIMIGAFLIICALTSLSFGRRKGLYG
jgi:hypothetical protein